MSARGGSEIFQTRYRSKRVRRAEASEQRKLLESLRCIQKIQDLQARLLVAPRVDTRSLSSLLWRIPPLSEFDGLNYPLKPFRLRWRGREPSFSRFNTLEARYGQFLHRSSTDNRTKTFGSFQLPAPGACSPSCNFAYCFILCFERVGKLREVPSLVERRTYLIQSTEVSMALALLLRSHFEHMHPDYSCSLGILVLSLCQRVGPRRFTATPPSLVFIFEECAASYWVGPVDQIGVLKLLHLSAHIATKPAHFDLCEPTFRLGTLSCPNRIIAHLKSMNEGMISHSMEGILSMDTS